MIWRTRGKYVYYDHVSLTTFSCILGSSECYIDIAWRAFYKVEFWNQELNWFFNILVKFRLDTKIKKIVEIKKKLEIKKQFSRVQFCKCNLLWNNIWSIYTIGFPEVEIVFFFKLIFLVINYSWVLLMGKDGKNGIFR